MNIKYWEEELEEDAILSDAIETVTAHIDWNVRPEMCFKTVRETMEEFAYRTAMTYTDEGVPSLYYQTTIKGISCRSAKGNSNECASSS